MIYFAYGSNMDPTQMAARCVSARVRGIGFLADHRLCFPRWSPRRRHAVASIEADPGAGVWGVLYAMTADDWTSLHGYEGHFGEAHAANRYDLIAVKVRAEAVAVAARTYVGRPDPERPDPGFTSIRYLQQLIDGAVAHRLPAHYVATLKAVPTFD